MVLAWPYGVAMAVAWLFVGIGIGVAVAVPVAARRTHREARRLREAERREAAAQRLAELGTMTGGLAHEIKNPLSTLGLNVQLIQEDLGDLDKRLPPDPEPTAGHTLPQRRGDPPREQLARVRKRVDGLHREMNRLREILEDYLRFAGRVVLDRRRVDLHALCEEMVDFFQPQADEAGVRLRTQLAARDSVIWADPTLLKQALLNLLINACQAMTEAREKGRPHGGADELILRTFDGEGDDVLKPAPTSGSPAPPTAGASRRPGLGLPGTEGGRRGRSRRGRFTRSRPDPAGRWVALQVIDTGPGMDAATREKIFLPYFSTKRGGSGLGLPTTRRLVEEHGGDLKVHAEPGRGTAFTLRLPRQAPPVEPGPDAATDPHKTGSPA